MEEAGRNGGEERAQWSARLKTEVVLRLFRGEDIAAVSRETHVPAHELDGWRRLFVEGGTAHLESGTEQRSAARHSPPAGELTLSVDLLEWLLERKGREEKLQKSKRSARVVSMALVRGK